jgi:hypothetical protein
MSTARLSVFVISFALACAVHAQQRDPGDAPATPSRDTSIGTGVKNTTREIGHGFRNAAREVKEVVKSGVRQVKRGTAVAQCNDGAYSYTRDRTCSRHGGVREQLR